MIDFFLRLFCKGYENENDKAAREKCGVFTSIVGIVVNVLLAGFKLLAGLLTGSIAIVADALNNFSDAGASMVSFVSFKISAKPADRDHPFGHARFEYVCSMIVSFLILLVGFELLMDSVKGFFSPSESFIAKNSFIITVIILFISILFKILLGSFYLKVAKKISSSVIKASAVDSFSDAVSTTAVLVSTLVVYYTDFAFVDSLVGVIVSVMILIAGIKILNETKNSLLGEAPIDEVVHSIKTIVSDYPEVLGIHDLLVHNYGPKNYIASFHAEVDGSLDVYMLHDKIDNIERRISQELDILCTIHLDPIVTDDEEVNALREFVIRKAKEVEPSIDIHDFRTVVGVTHTNLIFDIVLPFECKDCKDIDKKIEAEIQKERPECFCVITIDRA